MNRKTLGVSLIVLFFALGLTDAHFLYQFYQTNTDAIAIPILTFIGFIPLYFGVRTLYGSER